MLAVINFMLHDIDLYDSLDGENDDVSRVLMKWFPALYGNPPYWKVWNHYNDNTIQRQQDLHNCAFFYVLVCFPTGNDGIKTKQ